MANEMLKTGDKFDTEKMSHEIARQRRIGIENTTDLQDVLVCLKGDEMGMNQGLIKDNQANGILLREVHEMITRQATTRKHVRKDDGIAKIVYMLLGGGVLLGFIITTVVAFA